MQDLYFKYNIKTNIISFLFVSYVKVFAENI